MDADVHAIYQAVAKNYKLGLWDNHKIQKKYWF